jgi:serine/threonine-protein kinase
MADTVALPTSPLAAPRPGELIAGKYRLERELGRGAMGTVWAAVHVTLGQRVAIKLISADASRSPEARQRFGVEAKAAARLRSRHAVQVYDDGETPEGTPYIVMEYLEGETLEQRLHRERGIPLSDAVRITTHVGRALARAHAQGVVHRDLKSGNIFLAKMDDDELGWIAKVLDFGVAKVLSEVNAPSTTRTGTIVGTPLFMSPEQIRGAKAVDHRADLYSLGIVFYNMVTGAHAFDGPSYSDVLVAICSEALPDLRASAPWLSPAIKLWFDKACAREREARFQSADEMVEALQEAAGPGARHSRPSLHEDVAGPSGTLLGHVPPHAAATVLAAQGAELRAAASQRTPGDARHAGDVTPSATPAGAEHNALRGRRDSLWLWAAAGVGLAATTMALGLLVTRSHPSAPTPKRAAALTAGHGAALARPAPVAPPAPATPSPLTGAGEAPAIPAPPVTTSTPERTPSSEVAAETRVRRAPGRHPSSSPTPTAGREAATAARSAPVSPGAPGTPDMGF